MPHEMDKPSAQNSASSREQARASLRAPSAQPPLVPIRWLLTGIGGTIVLAAFCAWCTLCILFWQGNWQLLYHPASKIARTPASIGLAFDPVAFASNEAGQPRLSGWWIPASPEGLTARLNRYTVLFLHGRGGNLGNTLDELEMLHEAGVNVLAFDYRGYGQSQFARPSEAHWREDAGWALRYLTGTRHVAAGSIVLYGDELGANLALEIGAQHPELAGVVLYEPMADPVEVIFSDPRAQLVPTRLLMRDHYDLRAAAAKVNIPSLWLMQVIAAGQIEATPGTDAYDRVAAPKKLVWLKGAPTAEDDCRKALTSWLDGLSGGAAAGR
jgi:uncharacterized protein